MVSHTRGRSDESMRETITSLLVRRPDEVVVLECRRCGTSVESIASTCTACGCGNIVEYTIQ